MEYFNDPIGEPVQYVYDVEQTQPIGAEVGFSGWVITLQTNVVPDEDKPQALLLRGIKDVVEAWRTRDNLFRIFEFTNDGIEKRKARDKSFDDKIDYTERGVEYIDRIEWRIAPEITPPGSKNEGRFHAHIYVKVRHRTNLRLSYEGLKEIADDVLRADPYMLNGCYISIATAKMTEANIMRYLRKGWARRKDANLGELQDRVVVQNI